MFAKRIKFLRQSKELNQVQLAERLGVKNRLSATGIMIISCPP